MILKEKATDKRPYPSNEAKMKRQDQHSGMKHEEQCVVMYIIEDIFHSEQVDGKFEDFAAALLTLRRIAQIPFGEEPNIPPCIGKEKCYRDYHVLEFDDSQSPCELLFDTPVVQISASGVQWAAEFQP